MDQLEPSLSKKDTLIYSYKVVQLSKALWKMVEKDWQQWIKPFGLNINEHHILWISYHLKGASISDIARFGVMHVSTAFNFSKKLEERGLLKFSKRDDDKRNTYVELTEKGIDLILEMNHHYLDTEHSVLRGSLALKELYGRFPDFLDVLAVIRNVYGDDFIETFENSFREFRKSFTDDGDKLVIKPPTQQNQETQQTV